MSIPLSRTGQISRKEIRPLFCKGFLTKQRDLLWPLFCEPIDTFTKHEYFAMLGTVPQVSQVDEEGDLSFSDMREYTFDFENLFWSAGIRAKRDFFWYDQTKQSSTLINSLAARVANFPDSRFFTQLRAGTTSTSIFGTYFFSTAHAVGGTGPSTQSNILTGHVTTADFDGVTTLRPALAEKIQTDFDLALVQLSTWLDDNNQPVYQNIDPSQLVILCGPKLYTTMKLALGARFINQTDNIFQGVVGKIVQSNYLPSTGAEAADWYLAYTGFENKPMIHSRFRMRTDAEIQDALPKGATVENLDNARALSTVEIQTTLDQLNDSRVIQTQEHLIRANWLGEVTYGDPRTIVKVDNASS